MDLTRSLTRQSAPAALTGVPGARPARRLATAAVRSLRELARSQSFLLAAGGFAMLSAGALMNSGTTAFFTNAQTAPTNSFVTGTVSLGAPTFTAFNVPKAVPGDIYHETVQIANASDLSVAHYLTSFATASSGLDTDTASGLRLALFRCGTETAPADCASATTFETVTGVMDQAATQRVTTTGGVPALAGMTVSGADLVFTNSTGNIAAGGGATVATVPALTKNNPNTQGKCSVGLDGGCLLGGYNGVTVSNPATTVVSGSNTISIPALSSVKGLGADGGGSHQDHLLLYVILPSDAATTMQSLSSTLTFAFTAVQPAGGLNPAR